MIAEAVRSRALRSTVASSLVVAATFSVSCSTSSPGSGTTSAAAASQPNAVVAKHGPAVMGERLGTHVISDPQQGGMTVGVVAVPEKWNCDSKVVR